MNPPRVYELNMPSSQSTTSTTKIVINIGTSSGRTRPGFGFRRLQDMCQGWRRKVASAGPRKAIARLTLSISVPTARRRLVRWSGKRLVLFVRLRAVDGQAGARAEGVEHGPHVLIFEPQDHVANRRLDDQPVLGGPDERADVEVLGRGALGVLPPWIASMDVREIRDGLVRHCRHGR